MGSTINLRDLITSEALAQGVPPSIALAVAQQESGISQWTSRGTLVTGTSGEVGVFQLMPATARGLGVDPTDVSQNISGGVTFLAQLFGRYGSWDKALSAYNSGNPTSSNPGVLNYVASVLGLAGGQPPGPSLPDLSGIDPSAPSVSGTLVVGAIVAGLALTWWLLD
jgi:soluble lytic murein transglycosylase-like protein